MIRFMPLLGLVAVIAQPAAAEPHPRSFEVARESINVIDGDTFDAAGVRVRLWGISAPEIDAPGGEPARSLLTALLTAPSGRGLTCHDTGQRSHDRVVARCEQAGGWLKGRDPACTMVAAGHAQDWPKFSGGYYARCAGTAP